MISELKTSVRGIAAKLTPSVFRDAVTAQQISGHYDWNRQEMILDAQSFGFGTTCRTTNQTCSGMSYYSDDNPSDSFTD